MWACGEVDMPAAGPAYQKDVVYLRQHQCTNTPHRGEVWESLAAWLSISPALSSCRPTSLLRPPEFCYRKSFKIFFTTMAVIDVDQKVRENAQQFDIDNSAAVISDNPAKIYEEYRHLRKHCPVIHTSQYGGYWLMTRYEDVKRAAMDSETYISSVKAVVPSDPRGLRRPPLNFDAPAHTPFRTALERTVKPARLARLKGPLYEHAEAQLAPLLARAHGDISAEFGANFVARMESEWLNLEAGVATELATTAANWLNAWRMQDGEVATANSQKMYRIASDLLADRRINLREPEDDPASSLLLERDANGNSLSEENLV